jgi:hypothetical protein
MHMHSSISHSYLAKSGCVAVLTRIRGMRLFSGEPAGDCAAKKCSGHNIVSSLLTTVDIIANNLGNPMCGARSCEEC